MIKLRRYQDEAVAQVRDAFSKGNKSVLLALPTGAGKTVIFTHIASVTSGKGKKSKILVHRIELLRQTSNALSEFGVDHGMVNPAYTPSFTNNVQVASVQTIVNQKRLNYYAAAGWIPDLIIVDECHHATAGSWRKIISHFEALNPKIRVLGVTATPIRSDGQGLGVAHGGMFEELVSGPSVKWLQDNGYLVRAKVLSPPKHFADPKRKKSDWNANDLENLVNKPTITGDAVDHYEQVCKGMPTIVFCVSVKHTEDTAQEFRNRGYKFYAIDGTTDDDKRKRVLNGLADGSVDGVCSCDLINEGTDVPAATVAILLRPTQSLALHLQQIGRVLRPVFPKGFDASNATTEERLQKIAESEKPYAYVLDHVGNVGSWAGSEFVINHGLPDHDHKWSLDGEVKKRGKKNAEQLVRVQQCLSCFRVHEPAPICPSCGHIYEVKDKTPKFVDGSLTEVTADMIAPPPTKEEIKALRAVQGVEVGQAETIEDLIAIANSRGYNEGWVGHQYGLRKSKFDKIAKRKAAEAASKVPEPVTIPEPLVAGDWTPATGTGGRTPVAGDWNNLNTEW